MFLGKAGPCTLLLLQNDKGPAKNTQDERRSDKPKKNPHAKNSSGKTLLQFSRSAPVRLTYL
jgi:hypothetical protein